ncbi:MAG: hypothetical protein AVDCRST_MAG47-2074 [uncultured Nocardioidaceae bacterium]|uniref:Uncharacterized protein n=1 Tax=uncultured Nocardioidaceae bacterium TaxID=253824 RepID=A0A6J4N7C4_9ACTN|nr:MAG: hypothetical protein AVDCRST_MAG47-2074 [uncultured Nocardioidaceae bacterium]
MSAPREKRSTGRRPPRPSCRRLAARSQLGDELASPPQEPALGQHSPTTAPVARRSVNLAPRSTPVRTRVRHRSGGGPSEPLSVRYRGAEVAAQRRPVPDGHPLPAPAHDLRVGCWRKMRARAGASRLDVGPDRARRRRHMAAASRPDRRTSRTSDERVSVPHPCEEGFVLDRASRVTADGPDAEAELGHLDAGAAQRAVLHRALPVAEVPSPPCRALRCSFKARADWCRPAPRAGCEARRAIARSCTAARTPGPAARGPSGTSR